jgi:dUTP pyrophosphatase
MDTDSLNFFHQLADIQHQHDAWDTFLKHMTPFNIKRLTDTAILPTKAYDGDLGYDLYADEDVILTPLNTVKISTGIAVQFPQGWGGFIKDRSSMAIKKTITTGGVIDCTYTGELSVIMTSLVRPKYQITHYNTLTIPAFDAEQFIEIKKGDKIAQLVPIPVTNWKITEVEEFDKIGERGERGFGSSDNINSN